MPQKQREGLIWKINLLLHGIVVTFRLSPDFSLGPHLSLPKRVVLSLMSAQCWEEPAQSSDRRAFSLLLFFRLIGNRGSLRIPVELNCL